MTTLDVETPVETQFPEFARLEGALEQYSSPEDIEHVRKAFRYAFQAHDGQMRLSGEPYIIHPLAVAITLANLRQDLATVVGGLLHDVVEDTEVQETDIIREFGIEVAQLVEGVTKISTIKGKSRESNVAENIRKMLLATTIDARVMIIKLADKRHNMMTLKHQKPEKIERIAKETIEIYAAIAGRLGMYKIKSELEDLAFEALKPDMFESIKKTLNTHESRRNSYIKNIIQTIKDRLAAENIDASVTGRAKHLHSIYQKMQRDNKNFDQIYDLRGIRIIADKVTDCYAALGILHTLWKPIPGRFKDYIAMPKLNMYQSLHTTVICEDGKPLEIQIRTAEMHQTAEQGIAAHWFYKNPEDRSTDVHKKINWLNKFRQVQRDLPEPQEFMEHLRQDLIQDEIFVFTPQGEIIHMPPGATVLDFAFRIHTDIGLSCVGAKVDDKMVPIRSELKSGDQIEIVTRKGAVPSPTWLRYVKTPLARGKIRSFLKKKEEEDRRKFQDSAEVADKPAQPQPNLFKKVVSKIAPSKPKQVPGSEDIEVAGLRNVVVSKAKCCRPIFGDPIVGFVTRTRGVSVHTVDCKTRPQSESDAARYIGVRWVGQDKLTSIVLEVLAADKQGIYLKMVQCISMTQINMTEAVATREQDKIKARFTMDIDHADSLNEIIKSLEALPEVDEVRRLH